MPRFHFNILGGAVHRDFEGTELPDIKAAACEARRYAGRMLSDSALMPDTEEEWRVEVTDPLGLILLQIAVTVTGASATAQ